MPYDPELVAEARGWLMKSRQDLGAAQYELTAEPPFSADIVFHAQQAVEKCFKGFLAWHSIPFRKTHNLEELGEQYLEVDASLRAIVDPAVPLTRYAWMYRYPGDAEEPPRAEAEAALSLAREVYAAILSRLPEQVQP